MWLHYQKQLQVLNKCGCYIHVGEKITTSAELCLDRQAAFSVPRTLHNRPCESNCCWCRDVLLCYQPVVGLPPFLLVFGCK